MRAEGEVVSDHFDVYLDERLVARPCRFQGPRFVVGLDPHRLESSLMEERRMRMRQIPGRSRTVVAAGLVAWTAAAAPGLAPAQTAQSAHTLTLDVGSEAPPAALSDLAWLEGRWRGEALGGNVEETWFEPQGGGMPGFFRAVRDGKVMFYEAWAVIERGGSLVLRLKHFSGDFTGWEDKDEVVEFPLVKLSAGAVHFDGLTYVLEDRDHLRSYVVVRETDGSTRELGFAFERVE